MSFGDGLKECLFGHRVVQGVSDSGSRGSFRFPRQLPRLILIFEYTSISLPCRVQIEGDRQLLRFRVVGVHSGEFLGIPAKGSKIDLPALMILKLNEKGQVAVSLP